MEYSVNLIIKSQDPAVSCVSRHIYPCKIKTEKKIKSSSGSLCNYRRHPAFFTKISHYSVYLLRLHDKSYYAHFRSAFPTDKRQASTIHGSACIWTSLSGRFIPYTLFIRRAHADLFALPFTSCLCTSVLASSFIASCPAASVSNSDRIETACRKMAQKNCRHGCLYAAKCRDARERP